MSGHDTLGRDYNNRELIPDHEQYFARWAEGSARARATMLGGCLAAHRRQSHRVL